MFVYDITNQESYDELRHYLKDVDKNGDKETVKFLVGSKCDLSAQRVVKTDTAAVLIFNFIFISYLFYFI